MFILLQLGNPRISQEAKELYWGPLRSDGVQGEDPEGGEPDVPEKLARGDDLHGPLPVTAAQAADYGWVVLVHGLQAAHGGRGVLQTSGRCRGRRRQYWAGSRTS